MARTPWFSLTHRGRAASTRTPPLRALSPSRLATAPRREAQRCEHSPSRAALFPAPPATSARPAPAAKRRPRHRASAARGARPDKRRVAPSSPPPGWSLCFSRAPSPRARRRRPRTWTTWRRGRWRARRFSRRRARRLPRRRLRRRRRPRLRPRRRPRATDAREARRPASPLFVTLPISVPRSRRIGSVPIERASPLRERRREAGPRRAVRVCVEKIRRGLWLRSE